MRILLCLLLIIGLNACGKSTEKPAVKLFEPQREALEKASDVAQMMQQNADAQRLEIEKRTAE